MPLLLLLLLFFSSGPANAQSWPTAQPEARAGTRWWWLGSAVSEQDLRWAMREYSKTGIGTLEITPIYGVKGNEPNELSYLSPEWMHALSIVQDEARRDTLLIDMNTGTGWPFGGPHVPIHEAAAKLVYTDTTISGNTLRQGVDISVRNERERPYAHLDKVMAFSHDAPLDLTPFVAGDTLRWDKAPHDNTYRLIAVYTSRTRQRVKRAAPGGEGYVVDHFDRQAVANYLKRFEEAFERTSTPYPRTFFNDSYEVYGANWTPRLFEEFQQRRGYKLEHHLLELLGLKPDPDNRVLCDYRETLSDLLLENFTEQWTAWAHAHGAQTRNQAHGSPANLIDQYSAVDIPEIEGFGLSDFGIQGLRADSGLTSLNDSDITLLKYASSAAHINGRTLVSSETFTWLTEHFRTSLSQCKPDLDLMFTCGVNRIFFHGTTFSPPDDPWPGWKFYASIDMSPTNSIWRDAPYMLKYIERCQSFLQMGTPDNDFLVYLPVRDMWSQRTGSGDKSLLMQFDIHSMQRKAPAFIADILAIDRAGFDCDYISDRYLLQTHYVDGMLQTHAGTRYAALIIPQGARLSPPLHQHLDSLIEQGATIIHGVDEQQMNSVAQPEPLRRQHGLRVIRRRNATGHHYFIANLTPRDVNSHVQLTVAMRDARLFNPLNGDISRPDITAEGIHISLRSGESIILQTYNTEQPLHTSPRKQAVAGTAHTLEGPWTLSFPQSTPAVDTTFVINSLQTWETLPHDSLPVTMATGAYTTQLHISHEEAQAHWGIHLGDVRESARVYVNDSLVGCAWAAPFTLHCGRAFRPGTNTIRIEVTNLPANRIAHLDRQNIPWRKFREINLVDINYRPTTYAHWQPLPSGLNTNVSIFQIK